MSSPLGKEKGRPETALSVLRKLGRYGVLAPLSWATSGHGVTR
jgi:hypothetical protein